MNRSLLDCGGGIMVISQFTLLADCRKGRRPSFGEAEEPKRAEELYCYFVTQVKSRAKEVRDGKFGRHGNRRYHGWTGYDPSRE